MKKRIKVMIEYDAGIVDLDEEDLEEERENREAILKLWKEYFTEDRCAVFKLDIKDVVYEDV